MSKHCLFFEDWVIPTNPANLFGAVRKYDVHTGIDIFMHEGAPVCLPFDGEVVKIGNFTGSAAEPTPSPWWNDTQYIIVRHDIPIWNSESLECYTLYGEINVCDDLIIGCEIPAGSVIGNVVKVLKNDKGLPTSMLHIEIYDECPLSPAIWNHNEPKPDHLHDPLLFLNVCHYNQYGSPT